MLPAGMYATLIATHYKGDISFHEQKSAIVTVLFIHQKNPIQVLQYFAVTIVLWIKSEQ